MSELTREQIEIIRKSARVGDPVIDSITESLCDMALRTADSEERAERAEARAGELDRMVRAVRDRAYDDGDDVGEGWYRRADELCPPEALTMPSDEQPTPEQAQDELVREGQERGEYGDDALAAFERLCNWYSVTDSDDVRDPDAAKYDVEMVRRHLTASAPQQPEDALAALIDRVVPALDELSDSEEDQYPAEAALYHDRNRIRRELRDELERASAPAVPDVARESEVLRRMTLAIREADREFERVGGSTRHYVRDCLMPVMEEKGLAITSIADTEMNDE